jgi:hypothetical protein
MYISVLCRRYVHGLCYNHISCYLLKARVVELSHGLLKELTWPARVGVTDLEPAGASSPLYSRSAHTAGHRTSLPCRFILYDSLGDLYFRSGGRFQFVYAPINYNARFSASNRIHKQALIKVGNYQISHVGTRDVRVDHSVSRQLTSLGDMLKQVLDCMHTISEAPPAPTYQAPPPYGYPPMWGNAPGAPYYAHPPASVNPHDPRTRPAPTPPVVSPSVTPAPPAPAPVSQAAPVAPAPVTSAPPKSGTPAAASGDPSQPTREPLQPHPPG